MLLILCWSSLDAKCSRSALQCWCWSWSIYWLFDQFKGLELYACLSYHCDDDDNWEDLGMLMILGCWWPWDADDQDWCWWSWVADDQDWCWWSWVTDDQDWCWCLRTVGYQDSEGWLGSHTMLAGATSPRACERACTRVVALELAIELALELPLKLALELLP